MSSDNNSDAEKKHWSYVEHMWITYKNNDSSERKDFYSDIKGAKYPDDAFRIPGYQYQIAPEPEELFVQYLTVTKLEDLYRLAHRYDTADPKPLYRGQSNYSWKLETHLERNVPESVLKETGLERYELKIMTEAQQRFHEFFSQLPDEEDYLSWLSFLRHRGVPTRLLDVTRSLYIACYFAIRDAQPNVDAALCGSFRLWKLIDHMIIIGTIKPMIHGYVKQSIL